MALNSYSWTTVARQKIFQGITGSTNDSVIEALINAGTDFLESELGGRRIKQTTYANEEYDGTGSNQLILSNWPVASGTTPTLQRRTTSQNEDSWETENTTDYKTNTTTGIISFTTNRVFLAIPAHYRVTYQAGYDFDNAATYLSDAGAGDLELACWMLIRDLFNQKNTSGNIKSESIGNYSVEFAALKDVGLHPEVQAIIRKYTRPQIY